MNPFTYPARPMNMGSFESHDLKFPYPGEWYAEPKYNGWRAMIHIPTGTMFNRHGKPLTIANEFKPALDALRVTLDAHAFKWADCEALERRHNIGKGTLIVLDVVPSPADLYVNIDGGGGLRPAVPTYEDRRRWLEAVLPVHDHGRRPEDNALLLVPSYPKPWGVDKPWSHLWHDLQGCNRNAKCEFYEGLVFKRADSAYPVQLRSDSEEFSGWIKSRWKF